MAELSLSLLINIPARFNPCAQTRRQVIRQRWSCRAVQARLQKQRAGSRAAVGRQQLSINGKMMHCRGTTACKPPHSERKDALGMEAVDAEDGVVAAWQLPVLPDGHKITQC
jgi:hypothetical protein